MLSFAVRFRVILPFFHKKDREREKERRTTKPKDETNNIDA